MKQLFFALAVALLLSACNNNKQPEMGGNMFGNNKGKSPWQNNNNNNNNGNVNNTGGGRWSPALRNAIMQGCLGEVGNDPQAREKCDCWVGKVEARFPNAQTADQIPEEAANQLATECMQQFGGGNYVPPVNNEFGNDNINNNNINDGGVTARTWPAAQRQQWIMGCAGNAQQTFGLNQQQATEYCDCITRKVEQKYTFAEAVRLTVQDFSTPEWEAVRMNCQAALGY
ncbi:MAG: hypothetical protein KA821_15020 [Chitinophagaceae bacterium]|nr:hypothetical protein [Chitinophagaceae bacterium]